LKITRFNAFFETSLITSLKILFSRLRKTAIAVVNFLERSSFIGMVSSKTNVNYFQLILAGCLFSLIYLHKGDVFSGYGGALGTIAGIALLTSFGFSALFSNISMIKNLFSKPNKTSD
ncbi:MAG: hypothetical protein ABJO53_06110, partial [Nonlabens ulvanivorans]